MAGGIDAIKILGSLMGNGALSKGSGNNVLGNILGAAIGGGGQQQSGGALSGMLGGLLGGNSGQQHAGQQSGNSGLPGMLGSILGGQKQSSGGLTDLLGGAMSNSSSAGLGGMGGLLSAAVSQFAQNQNSSAPQTSHQSCDHLPAGVSHGQASDQASLMIRAMVNAAKSDGQVDQNEQNKILSKLGDLSQDEANFLRNEFAQPLDIPAFTRSVPGNLSQQVYAVSLMAIDLDTNPEAQYLDQLAQGLNISHEVCNQLHEQLGVQKLYS